MSAQKTNSTVADREVQCDAPEDPDHISHLHLESMAPNQFDAKYEASKYEFWAYCGWYTGNSGLLFYQFATIAFQSLLTQAAGTAGILRFAGRDRTVNSIVLLCIGITCCIEAVIYLMLGSFADFGTWRPNILIFFTVISIATGFSWLGVHSADQWRSAAALYNIGLGAWTVGYTFWTAAFVGLARSDPALQRKAEALKAGDISQDEYNRADSMTRSRYYNIPAYVLAPPQVLFLAVCIGILYALDINKSEANSNWGISVVIAFLSGISVLFSLPWFVLEKRRPGQILPAGMGMVGAGLWQLWKAASQVWKLRQTLLYFIGYFLMTDSFFTTTTLILTLQNEVIDYDLFKLSYLAMIWWTAQFIGVYGYWIIQHKFNITPKTMYCWTNIFIVLLNVWGMVGIWTQKFGFHHPWEFWVYQGWWGLVTPFYNYSQIMVSEVTPRGKEFLFFSLFNLVGYTSALIGPIVSSAIIDASSTRNNSFPFYYLTAVSLVSFLGVLFFVDPDKSQREQAAFLENEQLSRERLAATRMRERGGEVLPDQIVK